MSTLSGETEINEQKNLQQKNTYEKKIITTTRGRRVMDRRRRRMNRTGNINYRIGGGVWKSLKFDGGGGLVFRVHTERSGSVEADRETTIFRSKQIKLISGLPQFGLLQKHGGFREIVYKTP